MPYREVPLVTGGYYHVYSKSIAEFEIFRFREEYIRMREALCFYRTSAKGMSYSAALNRLAGPEDARYHGPARARLITYCIMPTHFHLLLEQLRKNGISEFLRMLLASHSKFFNKRCRRKGPLWESRFENRLIESDEDLMHMTRYIHLNPVSAGLVKRPEDWEFSSYQEYLGNSKSPQLCEFRKNIPLTPDAYKKFVNDRADYQRNLQVIKAHLIDDSH